MSTIFFLTLLSQVISQRVAQFEKGNVVIAEYSQSHILETSTALPRFIEVQVNFQKAFSIQPQVFITSQRVDWEGAHPTGFIEQISSITTTGFKLAVYAVSTSKLYGISSDWLASDDPRLYVIQYESTDLSILKSGSGGRIIFFTIGHPFQDATQGIISLVGIRHIKDFYIIETKVEQVNSNTVIVSANTYTQSALDYLKFNILLGTDQSLWTSQALYFTLSMNANHPFVSRSYFGSSVYETILFQQQQFNDIPIVTPLITKRGYDINSDWNACLMLEISLTFEDINVNLGICSHTFIYGIYYQIALYNPKLQLLDEYCAYIFSQCDYSGNQLIICQSVSDLTSNGWSQPVKSLIVPTGGILTLFQQINYQGTKNIFNEDQQCISSNSYLSAKFLPLTSYIKILFLNISPDSNCHKIIFYSQCNYQGASYTLNQGEHLKSTLQIPFEIKSISLCPKIRVTLKDHKYQGGGEKHYFTSQPCLNSFQFPKYRPI